MSGYVAATDERVVHQNALRYFDARGKVSGHGLAAWLPAPRYLLEASEETEEDTETKAPQLIEHAADLLKGDPRPTVAILDSGIRPHAWLQDEEEVPNPLWEADPHGPTPRDLDEDFRLQGEAPNVGSHVGHATFLAGIIRQAAPRAGLLSHVVMDEQGHATDAQIITALERLANPDTINHLLHDKNLRLDVVLMAFGRQADAVDADLASVAQAMKDLAGAVHEATGRELTYVVAAGNDGVEGLHYPAAFAAEPGLRVIAVGGLGSSPTERAAFSNYGPWVDAWRYAKDIFGAMPLKLGDLGDDGKFTADCFAWWSGTSFAAAQYAGELLAEPATPPPSLPPQPPNA